MFECLTPAGVVAAALIAPPGAEVMAALCGIDPLSLSDYAQVDYLLAWERQAGWVASCTQPALAAVGATVETAAGYGKTGQDSTDMPLRAAHAEIAAGLRVAESTAGERLAIARALAGPLSAVQAALCAGDISYSHARVIWETTTHLCDDKQAWVAARVLPRARRQSVTQLRRTCNRAVQAAQPRTAADKARQAHRDRSLDWWALPDGMAELRLIGSAADVMAVYGAADTLAKHHAAAQPPVGADGWNSLTALRSDALIDLATGASTSTSARTSTVTTHVTIDLPTLLGLQDNPAELAGYGPLPAAVARALSADSRWRRLIYEPLTGALLDLGHTTYQPTAELDRYIRARDNTCGFPTCNRAAARCDVDHTNPYTPDPTGGGTDRGNLGAYCRAHHRLKHKTGWQLTRDPDTEQATWTSITGHQ